MNGLLASATSVVASNFIRLPHPYKLTFALTYHCNSRCTICQIWKKPYKKELSLAEIERFFSTNPYFTWVNLTGGELILRNDFVQVVQTVLKTQPHLYFLNFTTNGLLTNKIVDAMKQIMAFRPPHVLVSVSLDGPETLHDKLRGIPGNWKRAIETYKKLKKIRSDRFDVYFGMTISRHNATFIEETYESIKKEIPSLKRTDIHFNIAHYSSHFYGNVNQDVSFSSDPVGELIAYNKKKGLTVTKISWIEYLYQRSISKYLKEKKTPLPCRALSSSIFLDPYGNIYPCSMWNAPLGNIKHISYSIKNIWGTKKTIRILQAIQNKKCANCWTPCEAYQTILGNLTHLRCI